MGRRRTPRMPGLNVTHHTLAKIKRIGLRHRKSPPTRSESYSHPRWNPQRFNLIVRCSRRTLRRLFSLANLRREPYPRLNVAAMSLLAVGDAPLRPTDPRPHVKILPVMRCFG